MSKFGIEDGYKNCVKDVYQSCVSKLCIKDVYQRWI